MGNYEEIWSAGWNCFFILSIQLYIDYTVTKSFILVIARASKIMNILVKRPPNRSLVIPLLAYPLSNYSPIIQQKLTNLQTLKTHIQFIKPYINTTTNYIVDLQMSTGLPWWVIIILSCCVMRASIYPFNFIRRRSLLGFPILQTLKLMLQSLTISPTNLIQNVKFGLKAINQLTSKQMESTPIFLAHKLVHYPLALLGMVVVSKITQIGYLDNVCLFHISSLARADPYMILPICIFVVNIINLSKFITKSNKHLLITKVRKVFRVLSVAIFPVLLFVPSSVNLFILTNCILTTLQNWLTSPKRGLRIFRTKIWILGIIFACLCYLAEFLGIATYSYFMQKSDKTHKNI